MPSNNYRLPPEWELHECTWLVWPQNSTDWPGKFSSIKWVYAEIVKNLTTSETVKVLVDSINIEEKAKKVLFRSEVDLNKVEFFKIKTNRSWLRDSGPFFVKNSSSETNIVDFGFNAWARYKNWESDNQIPNKISNQINIAYQRALYNGLEIILEGGCIDVNGEGLLLTTEQCLLNTKKQVRNKNFSKSDYEFIFREYFGIEKIIWLRNGIEGDDTNGHIDNICRFVDNDTVVLCYEEDSSNPNYYVLKENKEKLINTGLEIVDLPMPSALYFDNYLLPASYANFYVSNDKVLVPTFNDINDYRALGIISELFPDRKVVGIYSVDLILGLGSIHCLTKEQPI